jgi:hypothetical protein
MKSFRTVRTSMVVIGVEDRQEVYSSIDAVPPDLRKRLLRSTAGDDAATILIADRAGRDAVFNSLRARLASQRRRTRTEATWGQALAAWLRTWGAVLVSGAVGLMAWVLATYR